MLVHIQLVVLGISFILAMWLDYGNRDKDFFERNILQIIFVFLFYKVKTIYYFNKENS